MTKYAPIEDYLRSREQDLARLTYPEIEKILGFPLPHSAHKHRAWWSNGKTGGTRFWLRVGWKVDSVTLGECVAFRKAFDIPVETEPAKEEVFEGAEKTAKIAIPLNAAYVTGLIKDMHLLKLGGVITPEEFEDGKKRLLEKF